MSGIVGIIIDSQYLNFIEYIRIGSHKVDLESLRVPLHIYFEEYFKCRRNIIQSADIFLEQLDTTEEIFIPLDGTIPTDNDILIRKKNDIPIKTLNFNILRDINNNFLVTAYVNYLVPLRIEAFTAKVIRLLKV